MPPRKDGCSSGWVGLLGDLSQPLPIWSSTSSSADESCAIYCARLWGALGAVLCKVPDIRVLFTSSILIGAKERGQQEDASAGAASAYHPHLLVQPSPGPCIGTPKCPLSRTETQTRRVRSPGALGPRAPAHYGQLALPAAILPPSPALAAPGVLSLLCLLTSSLILLTGLTH